MKNIYKFDIAPFETGFEFEDMFESFDEYVGEVQNIFPEYDEAESWLFRPESADLEWEWAEEAAKERSTFLYVKSFASSDADCVVAMNSAKKPVPRHWRSSTPKSAMQSECFV